MDRKNSTQSISSATPDLHDVKPQALDGGYGWVIVCAAFLNCSILGGSMVFFSLIYIQIAEHFNASLAVVGFVQSFMQALVFFPGNNAMHAECIRIFKNQSSSKIHKLLPWV